MEEIAEQEKELARIEAMENALDVTKQDNMVGFYRFSLSHHQPSYHDCFGRHLYRQTFGEEKGQKAPIKVEETEEQKAARVKEELKKLKVEEEVEGSKKTAKKSEEELDRQLASVKEEMAGLRRREVGDRQGKQRQLEEAIGKLNQLKEERRIKKEEGDQFLQGVMDQTVTHMEQSTLQRDRYKCRLPMGSKIF